MEISTEQLKAQRELVKRHLDWLDACIAESSRARPVSPVVVEAVPIAGSPVSVASEVAGDVGGESAPAKESHAEALLSAHGDMSSGLSSGAKFGCVAIALAVVLGFLFVLFVLPRFLYKKNGAEPATQEQVSP